VLIGTGAVVVLFAAWTFGHTPASAQTLDAGGLDVSKTADAAKVPAGTPIGFQIDASNTAQDPSVGSIIVESQKLPAPGSLSFFDYTGDLGDACPTPDCATRSFSMLASGSRGFRNLLAPGTYRITQSDPAPGFTLSSLHCDDGSSATPSTTDLGSATATVKLDPGETVRCRFTNTDPTEQPTERGYFYAEARLAPGTESGDINVNFNAPCHSTDPALLGSLNGSDGYCASVDPGAYDLTSTDPGPSFKLTSINCDDGSSPTPSTTDLASASATVNVDPGETVRCVLNYIDLRDPTTAHNVMLTDQLPTGPDIRWSMDPSVPGCSISGTTLTCAFGDLAAGESASVHVTSPSTNQSCGTYDNTAIAVADNLLQVQASASTTVVCQLAHLIVIKHVVNDNGGTSLAGDFAMTINGVTAEGGNSFAGAETPGTDKTLSTVGSYNVTESGPSGYGVTFSADCAGTVAFGQTKTCTVTNNDNAPALHLRKIVTNDNGGTALATAWTLHATGTGQFPTNLSGATPVDSGSTFSADTYTLGETGGLSGYTAGSWSCVVTGTQTPAIVTKAAVVVGLGDDVTCTISNDDIAPKLYLRKVVVNDNGGTKTVSDFTLTANGSGTNDLSGHSPLDSGAGLQADTWALSETNLYGYSASAWSCVGGTQSGSNITIGIGGSATCTITNDDQPGTIIIKKITKPVNTGSFGFTTTGSGYNGFNLPGGGQNTRMLNVGTYTLREGTQLGWILTGIGGSTDPNTPYNCTVSGSGGSTGVGNISTQTATISLKNGDTVTCVFENTGQGVTRTQGFWATHTPLANIAWFGGTAFGHTFPGVAGTAGIGDRTLCGRPIDTLGKLMGGFWSSVSTKSTGAKRAALDQARMQLVQQLLAAELNASAFGSVPSGGAGQFAAWEGAYCGTNTDAIKNAQQAAASFNSAGDNSTFTPGTSADSKNARAIASIVFWDTP
jgi:hypothetical protein